MKKFLLSVACLCLLAVLVPAAKLNAAETVPGREAELNGTVQIGSTMTVSEGVYDDFWEETDPGIAWYRLNAVAGQSYYIAGAEKESVAVDVYKYNPNDENMPLSYLDETRNLYAVTSETWYIKLSNYNDSTPMSLSLVAGQNFTGTVTKNDRYGDNYYYFKPVLSGEYTFEMTSSDPDSVLAFEVGYLKRDAFNELSRKNIKYSTSFDKSSVTVSLQAGQLYVIRIYNNNYYKCMPYTLALTQSPTVPVDKVVAKKAVSKKAKKAVVTWKKVKGASGYEITYSLKKNYKKAKVVKVSAKKAKVTLKKLKRGKTYYVKVRAFKTVEGNDYFGAYSKTMKVKVK